MVSLCHMLYSYHFMLNVESLVPEFSLKKLEYFLEFFLKNLNIKKIILTFILFLLVKLYYYI